MLGFTVLSTMVYSRHEALNKVKKSTFAKLHFPKGYSKKVLKTGACLIQVNYYLLASFMH